MSLFPYQIQFENSPQATAPAQQVTITDQLDPNLDLSTFQLTGIGFGDTVLTIPAGSQMYQTTVSMTYNNETFDVVIEAGINYSTGQVYAKFQSIDPNTQLPPDVLTGYLPPEERQGTGRGEGYVSYIISPKPGIANGTVIRNVAVITFDSNPPLSTDQISDTNPGLGVDPTKQDPITVVTVTTPSSSVSPLPATMSSPTFTVSWSGQDPGGPGIASYNIWVSIDGGAYTEWVKNTTATSAVYTAITGTHTYAFYSQATDYVGNVEAPHTTPDTTTTDVLSPPTVVNTLVAGSGWTTTYLNYLQSQGMGNGTGYSIPVGSSAQFTTLPWTNLNEIEIVFNQAVNVQESDLTLDGVNTPSYSFSGFSYNATTFTATWTLASPMTDDRLQLDLDGHDSNGVTNSSGTLLEGTWNNGVSTYPSGNGTNGTDFVFDFNVLPGDVDGNNGVNGGDYLIVRSQVGKTVGSPGYNFRADVTGQGTVTIADANLVRALIGSVLPSGHPAVVSAPTGGGNPPSSSDGGRWPFIGPPPSNWGAASPAGCCNGSTLVQQILADDSNGNASNTITLMAGDYTPVNNVTIADQNASVPHKTLTIIGAGPTQTIIDGGDERTHLPDCTRERDFVIFQNLAARAWCCQG